MDIVLAQFMTTPIPEPVSLGLVLAGLAIVWFRGSGILPAPLKARVATRRNLIS